LNNLGKKIVPLREYKISQSTTNPKIFKIMSKITLQTEIQEVDFPIEEIIGIPNTVTIKAMEEAQKLMNDKNTKFFTDLRDFLDYLKK
jgi:hypothetical protein